MKQPQVVNLAEMINRKNEAKNAYLISGGKPMKELFGRKVLISEMRTEYPLEKVRKLLTMNELSQIEIKCLRCGSIQCKKYVMLTDGRFYCPDCIQLGRVDSFQSFYHLPEPKPRKRSVYFCWEGELTTAQKQVSKELLQSVMTFKNRIVWAVTGAGKTEMLFETLHYCLEQGYRIGIASPRVDVCVELYPRIKEVFPKEDVILLHGDMEEDYRYTKLLLCTTHQLLRFYRAFDLLIIDEVDAFPFVNNDQLDYAVSNALKKVSSLVYLTATPTSELTNKIKQKKLAASILPARYHRRKLPVPKLKWCSNWEQQLRQTLCPKQLRTILKLLLDKNDVLIFCPSIVLMSPLKKAIKKTFPEYPLTVVHSQDPKRLEKIKSMRIKKYRILITSTILERGVTFEKVSVIVLGANHPIFSTSALVQISGRVDRKMVYTDGEIWFLHQGRNNAIKEAVKQIKWMNTLAEKRGFIDEL